MQALRAYPLAIVAFLAVGCHVEGSVKASTSEEGRADLSEPEIGRAHV